MLAVGHISVSYLVTRGLKKGRWSTTSIPLVWIFSLLPDVDLLIPGLRHMGPTHSLFFAIMFFLPIFIYYRGKILPYFLAYLSHTVLGDLFTNRSVMFLWPFSSRFFRIPLPFNVWYKKTFNTNLELVMFGLFCMIFFLTKDYARELYSGSVKYLFFIPFIALLVPVVFSIPVSVPLRLIIPHLVFMVVCLHPFYPDSLKSFLVSISERY